MQYQLQIKFSDGRTDVVMQARDERSAFDTFAAMSRVPGVKAVSMAGIRHEFLPGTEHGAGQQQQQPGQAPEQREDDRMRAEREQETQAQRPIEMGSAPDPVPQQQQQHQQNTSDTLVVPEWMKAVKNAAAALGPEYGQPLASSNHGDGGWDATPAARSTGTYQPSPPPPPYQQQQQSQSSGGDGRSPLEQHSGHLDLGMSQVKRFKREVAVPIPDQRMRQQQQVPQHPLSSGGGGQNGQSIEAMLGLDSSASQGGGRPLNKQDAEMLTKARQALEDSFTNPQPGKMPMDVSSTILQRCVPLYSNVNWGSQPAYREEFNRLVVNCQRILTGQAAPGHPTSQQGRPVVFDQ
jgi:hypothetical protein